MLIFGMQSSASQEISLDINAKKALTVVGLFLVVFVAPVMIFNSRSSFQNNQITAIQTNSNLAKTDITENKGSVAGVSTNDNSVAINPAYVIIAGGLIMLAGGGYLAWQNRNIRSISLPNFN